MSDDDARSPQDAESRKDPLNTVLEEIRRSELRMERRLRQLEADVQRGQEEAVEKAAKRARRDKPIMFRRKAHREQFDFNERVTECLEMAAEEIAKKTSKDDVAKQGQGHSRARSRTTGIMSEADKNQ